MQLKDVLKDVKVLKTNVLDNVEIKSLTSNSKEVIENSMFLAIKGFETDGNKYIKSAMENGAVVVVTDELPSENVPYVLVESARFSESKLARNFFENPSKDVNVIGVTGTNGKTTTTYLIKHVLDCLNQNVGLIGTNQNIINGLVKDAKRTTEGAIKVQEMLKTLKDVKSDALVMEVSSHALALGRVSDVSYKVGVYTNLSQDHLDFHKDLEDYANEKSKLFKQSEFGVINVDDEFADVMIKNATCKILTYGVENEKADLNAKNIKMSAKSVEFDLEYKGEKEQIIINAPGHFNIQNGLGAIGALLCSDVKLCDIAKHLKTSKGVKGRVEVVEINKPYTVIIDYAHTPDGIINVLKTLKEFTKGRLIALFGCGGDRDKTKRPLMGKAVVKYADISIVTSDNPRNEEPSKIIEDIIDGIKEYDYEVMEDRRKAIKYALEIAKENDVVVLLGKGHETYQEIKGVRYDFDERKIVLE